MKKWMVLGIYGNIIIKNAVPHGGSKSFDTGQLFQQPLITFASLSKITLELHSINDKCLIRFSLMVVEKMFFETCLVTTMEIYSRRPKMIYILGVPTE